MTICNIYTHDKAFHADEVTACAVLRIVYPHAVIHRTREGPALAQAAQAPDCVVLDVGGVYDPAMGLYDHHQREGVGFRHPERHEWPFATAGLIWRHFGERAVTALQPRLSPEGIHEVFTYLDEALMKYVDAIDCGIRLRTAGPTISGLVSSFNPAWFEDASCDSEFPLVLDLMQVVVTNLIKRYAGKVLAREAVRRADVVMGGQVLVLPGGLPWTDLVAQEMPDIKLVVYPTGGNWQVRTAVGPGMIPRLQLPEQWGGLEHGALASASSVPDAVFCHSSRHLAGARSNAGVLALSACALANAQMPVHASA